MEESEKRQTLRRHKSTSWLSQSLSFQLLCTSIILQDDKTLICIFGFKSLICHSRKGRPVTISYAFTNSLHIIRFKFTRIQTCRQQLMVQANPSSMRPQASPADTVVVITGVSGGLGRALALELAQRGYTVVGCGRNEAKLLELEKILNGGTKHLLKKVDVTSDNSVKEFAETVMETKGAPDIVINFAGIINRNGKIWELSAAEFDAVLDVNVKGVANTMRHFLPLMAKQGLFVNITSGWGRIGAADVAPYCASKWAIEGLTQAVAKEVPQGVAVVALNPGVINTDMLVSCFGPQAALYQSPDTWAPIAADAILNLTAADNGSSLNV
ncbi:hypothetical protein GOP47_0009738 [Adiantum capillus-veneris]|uniref:Ketoreductase domain-containing protein n=1 Tax=Adiantum capillus-veneris TaxID=13818 RepID=A0A9D4UXN8_ADICA|nr:hypothetical protein GOP47_0009738 [Adiantum capillus-veneris]